MKNSVEKTWAMVLLVSVLAFGILIVWIIWDQNKYMHGSKQQYVGAKTCQKCHKEQEKSWEKTRMATSFEVLRAGAKRSEKLSAHLDPNKDYTHDTYCLPCHTTGYGLMGGFISIEETPDMAGVGCEACHGAGGMYAGTVMNPKDPTFTTEVARKAGLVYPPSADVCKGCHNSRSPFVGMDYVFDYDERVKKGTHQHFKLKYKH